MNLRKTKHIKLDNPQHIEAGSELWIHLAPIGKWPQWDDEGNKVIQDVSIKTIENMMAAFDNPVLVDCDHTSEEGGSTKAMAWITQLAHEEGVGLRGKMEFTEDGAKLVSNGEYRYVSPVWIIDNDGCPTRLVSVALTNRPNLPVRAIGNSQKTVVNNNNAKEGNKIMLTKLIELLGLASEATEEEIVAAVTSLKEQVADFVEKEAEAEAEAFAAENEDKVEDKEALKNAFRKDPELARSILANCKKAVVNAAPAKITEPAKPVCNAAAAKKPVMSVKNSLAGKGAHAIVAEMEKNPAAFNH